jgi:hypothetical protein
MGPLVDRWRRGVLALGVALAAPAVPAAVAQAHVHHRSKHRHHVTRIHRRHRHGVRTGAKVANATDTSTTPSTALCSQGSPSQSFLSQGDFNYYVDVPGPGGTGFDGSTWSLNGGAASAGGVLDLPAGSQAVSPDVCITSDNPEVRMMVRSVNGGDGVQVSVSYYTSAGWSKAKPAGGVNGQGTNWTLSGTINLPKPPPPPPGSGPPPPGGGSSSWQIVRFTLTPGGGHSEFNLSGLSLAVPPPTPSTGPCSEPVLSQIFLPAGDASYYTPAPGQAGGGFVGTGWTLTGGANIVTTTRDDGTGGLVLDLPAGSMAVSPDMCVTSLYPTARMMLRSLYGGDDISFRVSYGGTNTWTNPHETGHVHGSNKSWTLSDSVHLQPSNVSGWQVLRVTLVPDGGHGEFQLYDLELDPYARG